MDCMLFCHDDFDASVNRCSIMNAIVALFSGTFPILNIACLQKAVKTIPDLCVSIGCMLFCQNEFDVSAIRCLIMNVIVV